ncbi:HNH endonuclease [Deinococcus sp.]|uniref:HNH endonuclease n=1 Tax=Deinococcus sp. TaxID=47478 RepID=UPI00286E5DA9|nr:HNH endonuclease [Deinococcus sp.]
MEDGNTKICIKCGAEKPERSFDSLRRKGQIYARRRACRVCLRRSSPTTDKVGNERKQARYETDPEYREKMIAKQKKYAQTAGARLKKSIIDKIYRNKRRAAKYATPITTKITSVAWKQKLTQFAGRCHWCGMPMGSIVTMDHVIPLSRGGAHSLENVVAACSSCNSSKNDKLPHEWTGRLL